MPRETPQQPITTDFILKTLKEMVESKMPISREAWLDTAFKLNLLRIDEAQLFNRMNQQVAQRKLEIYKGQEKRNVAATELEIEASDEYRFLKDQEDKLYSIDEFIRIAKKNSDVNF